VTQLPPDPPLGSQPRKAPPESVLAAPRNPVTRWNRKYLIAGATGLAAIVALGFYLGFGGAYAPAILKRRSPERPIPSERRR